MRERLDTNQSKSDYDTRQLRRANASARKYNNPYPIVADEDHVKSIDWDSDEYAITPNDPRWILPESFDLGAHPWYQALPEEEKIRVGMYRYAQVARVGSEFEEALISGIAIRNMWLPSGSAEKRYSTHEAEEEQRHILMFDEFVHRTGVRPGGAPNWFRNASYLVGPVAKLAPVAFWALVLAGEEPIDRTQRSLVNLAEKEGHDIHPLMHRVMKVHIEEEARHIGFADDYLRRNVEKMTPKQKKALAIGLPITLRLAADVMLKPSKKSQDDMGIPKSVADDTWWNSDHGQEALENLFVKTQRRIDELDLRDNSRLGRLAWKKSGLIVPDSV